MQLGQGKQILRENNTTSKIGPFKKKKTFMHKIYQNLANFEARFFFFFFFFVGGVLLYLFIYFCLFRATHVAYGGSQARGRITATGASLLHSHSHTRSEPHL